MFRWLQPTNKINDLPLTKGPLLSEPMTTTSQHHCVVATIPPDMAATFIHVPDTTLSSSDYSTNVTMNDLPIVKCSSCSTWYEPLKKQMDIIALRQLEMQHKLSEILQSVQGLQHDYEHRHGQLQESVSVLEHKIQQDFLNVLNALKQPIVDPGTLKSSGTTSSPSSTALHHHLGGVAGATALHGPTAQLYRYQHAALPSSNKINSFAQPTITPTKPIHQFV